jgi:formylglycine-generating enzyme required for sulfatase activity
MLLKKWKAMVKPRQSARVKQSPKNNAPSPIMQKEVIVAIIGVVGTILIAILNKYLPSTLSPIPTPTPIVVIVTETSIPTVTTTPNTSSNCLQGMAYVPGGTFTLGGVDADAKSNEKPIRQIYLDPYCIDINEVSNTVYLNYLSSAQIHQSTLYPNDNNPVVNVTWYEANKFCQYFGKTLPSEYQWEKAARGSNDNRIYPWGNSRDLNKANIENLQFIMSFVDEFESGGSPYGILNMAGNAAEWTQDWYAEKWYEEIPDFGKNPSGPESAAEGGTKVVRGGSLVEIWENARVSARFGTIAPDQSRDYLGFRCVSLPLK